MPPRKRQAAAAKKKSGSDVVQRALLTIGVDETKLSNQTVDQGWRVIRQTFRGACLTKHPDKGGDATEFIALLESFEVVKKAYEMRGFQSFVEFFSMGRAKKKKTTTTRRAKKTTAKAAKTTALAPELMGDMRDVRPISEFFMSALDADVAPYCIELARSGRSACQMGKRDQSKTKYPCTGINLGEGFPSEGEGGTDALVVTGQNLIAKDSIRCGFYVEESASYGFWSHLACWRVPKSFWFEFPQTPGAADWTEQAFMDAFDKMSEVIFTGWTKLSAAEKLIVVRHAMRQEHWASFQEKKFIEARARGVHPRLADTLKTETKKKIAPAAGPSSVGKEISSSGKALVKMEEDVDPESVVEAPPEILVPVPNVDGAIAMSLAKTNAKPKRFVLTGIFPELESSSKRISSLDHGKAQATRLIEDFGGVVRTAVSGQTDFLLVGSEPGVRKLTEARDRGVPLIDLARLLDMVHGKDIAEAPPVEIKKFSTGFRGSGLALDMSREQLDDLRVSAAAIAPPPAEEEAKYLPSTSKEPSPKKSSKKRKAPKSRAPPPAAEEAKYLPSTSKEPSPEQSSKKRKAPKSRAKKTKTPKCITNQAQTEEKTASKKRRKR